MRRAAAVTLAVGLLLGAVVTPALAAPGDGRQPTATTAAPRARITLVEQPAWAQLGGDFPVRVQLTGDTAGLQVRATVHQYLSSRTAFEETITRGALGPTQGSTYAQPVDGLPATPTGRIFTLPLQDPRLRDPARIRISMPRSVNTGVFPVEVDLWDPEDGQRIDGFVTHLVAVQPSSVGEAVGEPLRVAWIWHLADAPAHDPSGKPTAAFRASIAPKGRLGRIASLLSSAGQVPVTLAPNPETLDAWSKMPPTGVGASGIAAVRAAAAEHQVVAGPYVPINVPGLVAAGLGDEAALELAQGTDTLANVLDTRVDPRTSVVEPLDGNTLQRLRESGVDRVVVGPDALVPPATAPHLTPSRQFTLESGDRRFAAVQPDKTFSTLLDGDAPAALRAERLLAGLALVALEQPNQVRGIVLDTRARWDPDPDAVRTVLAGLRDNPVLHAVSLDDFFRTVSSETDRRDNPVVRALAPIAPVLPAVTARQYRAARDRLDSFANLVGGTEPAISRGQRALLVSLTSAWTGASGRRRAAAELAQIDQAATSFSAAISAPQARTVTLTSRDAAIPISILNSTGRRVRIRVKLQSDKLLFPNGSERVIELAPRNTTVRFDVEARASGTFPLRVVLASEDGRLTIQQSRFTVRSTVVSGVGVFLTIGAGLFLAIWWITHWRRSRRAPRRSPVLAT
jgi:hypothetical protein